MNDKIQKLYFKLCGTTVFHGVLRRDPLRSFLTYCETDENNGIAKRKAYATLVSGIYENGGSLTEFMHKVVFEDENVYVKGCAKGQTANPHVEKAVKNELKTFSEFAALTPRDFASDMGVDVSEIPTFDSFNSYMGGLYEERLRKIDKYGYGIFSSYGMFRLSDDKTIEPIVSADKIGMDDFVGYEEERGKVIANTQAFVEGGPAANTLLCGDAGAGKSSTVKAVANAFFDQGIRLIELRKDQLFLLPYVMGKISGNPLKFIIFIDDLSFNKSDDNFSMLKAALEGSASAKAENSVIYATSNRRHIVKENFSDRDGDEVHRNDTMQELISLSERFGLTVLFTKPDKKLYLQIVRSLAGKHGLKIPEAELDIRAEAFALRKGNRSARCAEQFIDSLL